jgi:hypothetical protein
MAEIALSKPLDCRSRRAAQRTGGTGSFMTGRWVRSSASGLSRCCGADAGLLPLLGARAPPVSVGRVGRRRRASGIWHRRRLLPPLSRHSSSSRRFFRAADRPARRCFNRADQDRQAVQILLLLFLPISATTPDGATASTDAVGGIRGGLDGHSGRCKLYGMMTGSRRSDARLYSPWGA